MSGEVFVDTNVLVYARDISEPEKQRQAAAWMNHLWRAGTGRLNFQVLQEFYVTVTEKLKPELPPDRARRDVRSLLAWRPVPADPYSIEGAWAIQDRYSISWWDALIVSAGQIAGCRYLRREDLQGQDFARLRIIDPFLQTPASL